MYILFSKVAYIHINTFPFYLTVRFYYVSRLMCQNIPKAVLELLNLTKLVKQETYHSLNNKIYLFIYFSRYVAYVLVHNISILIIMMTIS